MAGLESYGFVPEEYEAIVARIESKLEVLNTGFDFSPESPDGQLIGIFALEIYNAWTQLSLVYQSYNPQAATGAALRNIALLTGLPFGNATRSSTIVELQGTTGTLIPRNSLVADSEGNEFYMSFDTTIPSNGEVVAKVPGPISVPIGSITTILTPIVGWTGVTQTTEGREGTPAISEQQFRNLRQETVMRKYTSVVDAMQGRLLELGLQQATVANNSSNVSNLPDGTPPNHIHITVGEVGTVTDEEIAQVIMDTNALGCSTFGSTTVPITDNQGVSHDINFSKATAVAIEMELNITYLDIDNAGAETEIKNALTAHINSLLAGDDVIWSRLFEYITPYGKAQVNSLLIDKLGGTPAAANVVIDTDEYTTQDAVNITIVVV